MTKKHMISDCHDMKLSRTAKSISPVVDELRPEVVTRAFEIADVAMFALLETSCIRADKDPDLMSLADRNGQPVKSMDGAADEIREAVQWLRPRGYVWVDSDPMGEYLRVLRRPDAAAMARS